MAKSKFNSPLLGYNTNVRHAGKLFHIQTEDSGVDHPHIITHLFVEGTILATKKSSYEKEVEKGDLEETVRRMMRDQHREMFVELRDGVHDSVAERVIGSPLQQEPSRQPDAVPEDAQEPVRSDVKVQIVGVGDQQEVRVVLPADMHRSKNAESRPPAPKPGLRGRSIFDPPADEGNLGDDLITDKSLDEVILSYLTEDDLEE